jgi:hypothetical protein
MRVDSTSAATVPSCEPSPRIDVEWNRFRPLVPLEGRSPADRAEAHRVNVERRKLDLSDYQAFLKEHVEGAKRCKTLDELIAHGRPKLPDAYPWERGASTAENQDLAAVHKTFSSRTGAALDELGRLRAELQGRRLPLDVRVDAAVAVKASLAGREFGVEASLSDRSAAATVGGAGTTARCERDARGDTRCSGTVAGVTASRDGVDSVEVKLGGGYGRIGGGSVAAGVAMGRRVGNDAVSVRAEAKLGVDVKLLDAETVHRAFSPVDYWTSK